MQRVGRLALGAFIVLLVAAVLFAWVSVEWHFVYRRVLRTLGPLVLGGVVLWVVLAFFFRPKREPD
jgi:hypothetical protein